MLSMKYNDFQILNHDEYKILNTHYTQNQLDRTTTISKICVNIDECKSSLNQLIHSSNWQIKQELNKCFSDFSLILENLNHKPLNQIKSLTLFTFLKKISTTIQYLLTWQRQETKDYFKTIISSSIQILTTNLTNILTALENSNIKIFKFM